MTVPSGWQTLSLGKLVDVLDSKRIPLSASERKHREGSVPYYGATGQVGTIDKPLFDEPLILLGEDGVQFFDPYKHKAYKISGPSWVNNHAHVLRPKPDLIEFGFLLNYLNAFDYQGYANGTTRLKLTQGAMNSIPVHLPPLHYQKRIVEALDELLSRLDKALADLDHADTQALMFRRSVLNTLLKPQVVDSEPDVEFPTSVSWKPFTLGDLGKWVTGSTPSSSDNTNKGEDVLFVTPGDIGTGGKLGEVARRISSLGADRVRRIKSGSVILVCIGTIGKVAWTDLEITTNQQINTLEVDQSRFDIRFVHWLLASPVLQEQLWQNSTSTTVALINKKTLEKIPCIIPSLEEQRRIVETLDDHLSRLDSTRKSIANQRLLLSTLRRSILNKAFNVELGTN